MREPYYDTSRERQGHPRRVSISELPRLSRASTLDIELHYLKLHARCCRKHIAEALRRIGRTTIKTLKRIATLTFLLPLLPCALFFIGFDSVEEKLRGRFGNGGDDEIKVGHG